MEIRYLINQYLIVKALVTVINCLNIVIYKWEKIETANIFKRVCVCYNIILIMSKYQGPRIRIIRRFGILIRFIKKLTKFTIFRYLNNLTQFSYRLLEKQKFRLYYGIIEKQILYYIRKSYRIFGSTGKIFMIELEIRLDNIVYRLSWRLTIIFARQIIRHGHILVNYIRIIKPRF